MTPNDCPVRMKNGVYCDDVCVECGFNPTEQKRRLADGRFQYINVIHTIHNERNKPIHTTTNVCKTLIFKKGENNA